MFAILKTYHIFAVEIAWSSYQVTSVGDSISPSFLSPPNIIAMLKAFKYQLKPTKEQIVLMEKTFGCVRFIYNYMLDKQIAFNKNTDKTLSTNTLVKQITSLKKEKEWLSEVSNECLQQSVRNIEPAFKACLKNKFKDKIEDDSWMPGFKSKRKAKKSFKNIMGCKVDLENSKLKVMKLGWIKFYKNQQFTGQIKSITISKTPTGKYFASVLVDTFQPIPEKKPMRENTTIGVDVGIKSFCVLSDGTVIDNPKYYEGDQKRLAVLQRRAARKQKGSNRQKRAYQRVARWHEKIANKRDNFHHHTVNQILSENQAVVIEDLNVAGMLKNQRLAKSIQSAGWSNFFRILAYKCEWQGKTLIEIGRWEPSSRLCSCGAVNKDLKLSDRTWACKECGAIHDRDLNAAQNIKMIGLTKYAPAVGGGEGVEVRGYSACETSI